MNTPRHNWLQVHLSTAVILMFVAGGLMWLNTQKREAFIVYEIPKPTATVPPDHGFYGAVRPTRVTREWLIDPPTIQHTYGWPFVDAVQEFGTREFDPFPLLRQQNSQKKTSAQNRITLKWETFVRCSK